MNAPAAPGPGALAALAARLFCVDPAGTGVHLRALPGPARDAWLAATRAMLGEGTPVRRVPVTIPDGRLLGGLDLAATLAAGRPVAERGVLADADGGVVVLAMAERLPTGTAARIAAVMDAGHVMVERDGLALSAPARVGVVALDEGVEPDERPPAVLADRLAFLLDLATVRASEVLGGCAPSDIAQARARLPGVTASDDMVGGLCAAAVALGVDSMRAPLAALRVARAAAALAGRDTVTAEDAGIAAQLVFAPRATRLPAPPEAESEPPQDSPPEDTPPQPQDASAPDSDDPEDLKKSLDEDQELLIDAVKAVLPEDVLAQLAAGLSRRQPSRSRGRAGELCAGSLRGRPAGVRRGDPKAGARLDLLETLRAAAPWQRLRPRAPGSQARIAVRREDFRVSRMRQHSATTTIFVVDASGSSALHRLAEAKGAVELMLAECYVRRDSVAMVAFRGRKAEVLLPPTRSLVRAKRSLAGLAGGGGTPLADAMDAARLLADAVRRKGDSAVVVFLTDGRANVTKAGEGDRAQAEADALASARVLRAEGVNALLVDTSPRPQAAARTMAEAMGARYLPLPHADSRTLTGAVRAASLAG